MDKAIKERWVAALRSGEYKQGRAALRTADNTYCCLGVLCEIAVQDGIVPTPKQDSEIDADGKPTPVYSYGWLTGGINPNKDPEELASVSFLPEPVSRWSGVSRWGHRESAYVENLAVLNDNGASFAEIANIIEAEF